MAHIRHLGQRHRVGSLRHGSVGRCREFHRTVHALVRAVFLRLARLNALMRDAQAHPRDHDDAKRIERGAAVFDDLYASFRKKRT